MTPVRTVDAATARRFLVLRHRLAPPRSLAPGPDGVLEAFRLLGSVQFDPLSVAGRNHNLVLHARVRDYEPAWTDALLYQHRALFETYNKGLSLLPTAELPWYRIYWDDHQSMHRDGAFSRYEATVQHILAEIRARGPLSSLDFERKRAIDWYWGPTSESRAVLEALAEAGILGLARRDGNRRFYDLVERLFPVELLAQRPGEREQRRHKLLSRYRAHGLLGAAGQAEVWLGTTRARGVRGDGSATIVRAELRADLLANGDLAPVEVEGVRGARFVLSEELPLLEAAAQGAATLDAGAYRGPAVTFLAPLDPLAWDRDLLRQLFGFDYLWEVYVPERKRRWGYYVLPVLFGDRLVGRIEPRIDQRDRTVRILGAWWEDGFEPKLAEGFVPALRDALAAYLRFGKARSVDWAPELGAMRRLVGTRPRPGEARSLAGRARTG